MLTEGLLRLDDIAVEYFNLSPLIARRKAALGQLPVPAFRLADTGRGPLYVTKQALADYVSARIAKAEKLHRQMASA